MFVDFFNLIKEVFIKIHNKSNNLEILGKNIVDKICLYNIRLTPAGLKMCWSCFSSYVR